MLVEHDLVLGQHVIDELSRSLRLRLKLPPARAKEIVEFVFGEASQFIGESQPSGARVGEADARILGEALASRAHVFVTGDAALLRLRMMEDMKIVSPRGLWEILQAGEK